MMLKIIIATILLSFSHDIHCIRNKFTLKYTWDIIDFEWPSWEVRNNALILKTYIPENVGIENVKVHKDDMYFALPLNKPGVPVTLGTAKKNNWKNAIIKPFPNWRENVDFNNCTTFQSIQGFEVDSNDVLWVIDGERKHNPSNCPCKLVLLDLKEGGKRLRSFTFPDEICLRNGAFLNDIVIDETDGTFAYITDASVIDPGLIVYSREANKSWKIRDKSMFPDLDAADFKVNGVVPKVAEPIDGIALSPKISSTSQSNEKMVFYSAVTSLKLYGISTNILKDEVACRGDQWRKNIKYVGKKQSQTDGMVFNRNGDLYYTLIPLNAVGIWNFREPFSTSRILDKNNTSILAPNGFSFDDSDLYLLAHKRISVATTAYENYLHN